MRLVIDEHRSQAPANTAPVSRFVRNGRRSGWPVRSGMPVHHMLSEIVPPQEGRAHPQPTCYSGLGPDDQAEARVDVEAVRILIDIRQAPAERRTSAGTSGPNEAMVWSLHS